MPIHHCVNGRNRPARPHDPDTPFLPRQTRKAAKIALSLAWFVRRDALSRDFLKTGRK
jgi:hypothetical protein